MILPETKPMSKRRISNQQSNRIQQKQTRYQHRAGLDANTTLTEGLVIKRYSRLALIEDNQGNRLRCSIRPDIHSLVAGDRVIWQSEGHDHGVVLSVSPRESVLNRPDFRGALKPVAANITQVMIVIAPIPEISWALLDSYLVMAEALQLKACIVLNKTDIPCEESKQRILSIYEPLGYSVLFISKQSVAHDSLLAASLNGQTSVFVGQSGVGKSSIISRILPSELDIQTGEVSAHSNLGCHTTSNSCLYHLTSGGHLIDSPGVREFNLHDMPVRNIAEGFREFRTLITQCQFRNCNHQNAPGCAIMKALNEGLVSQARYDSYVKLASKFINNSG